MLMVSKLVDPQLFHIVGTQVDLPADRDQERDKEEEADKDTQSALQLLELEPLLHWPCTDKEDHAPYRELRAPGVELPEVELSPVMYEDIIMGQGGQSEPGMREMSPCSTASSMEVLSSADMKASEEGDDTEQLFAVKTQGPLFLAHSRPAGFSGGESFLFCSCFERR